MQLLLVTEEAEGIDKSYQPEIMIAMKMGDEYMRDAAAADLIIDQLYLGAFPAIHEKIIAIQCYHLAGGVTVESRYSGVISKDRNSEHKRKYEV